MAKNYLAIVLSVLGFAAFAQQAVPYQTDFETQNAPADWTHYALSGSDDWAFGHPEVSLTAASRGWETGIGFNDPAESSNRALETPAFDLSAPGSNVISFTHRTQGTTQYQFYVESSTDNGATWQMVNTATATRKLNWQSASGFFGNYQNFTKSTCFLEPGIQGQANVKFRFRLVTSDNTPFFGWVIEDFYVGPERYNLRANPGNEVVTSPNCAEIKVAHTMSFFNEYMQAKQFQSVYYWSADNVLDGSDVQLLELTHNTANGANLTQTFPFPDNVMPGTYYIIHSHDVQNTLAENDETDNVSHTMIRVKPVYDLPYAQDFEDSTTDVWEASTLIDPAVEPLVWALGKGYRHHIEGAHSGQKAWHTSKTHDLSQNQFQEYIGEHYVESPYLNLTSISEPIVMNFWFKDKYDTNIGYYDNEYAIEYNLDCAQYWYPVATVPRNTDDEWDTFTIPLDEFSTAQTIKFRMRYHGNYLNPDGIVFDDMYIGSSKPDLTIERTQYLRYTKTTESQMTLKYYLMNGGSDDAPAVTTRFYWSADAVFDVSDVELGTHTADALMTQERSWNDFTFTKPQTATGTYYIFYVIDQANVAVEMRENNNSGYFTVSQIAPVAFPYVNDFEGATPGWEHFADLGTDDWHLETVIADDGFKPEFTGSKGFMARNAEKKFSAMSRAFLLTPSFDLTTSNNPVLEFNLSGNNLGNTCACAYGSTSLSYSTDGGATWEVLQPQNNNYSHWYETKEYDEYTAKDVFWATNYTTLLDNPEDPIFAFDYQYTGRDMDRNTYFAVDISHLKDFDNIRFRFSIATENHGENSENHNNGVVIDNFAIREAYSDLLVPQNRQLYVSDLADSFGLTMWIKNTGNSRAAETTVRYYLSANDTFEPTDHFLGEVPVASIAPDAKFYVNKHFTPGVDLGDYQYLVYKIDNANAVTESDEDNNTGAWALMTQGITQYPYADNFDADVIHGWNGWSEEDFQSGTPAPYRMAHVHPPAVHTYMYYSADKMWYSELVPIGSWQESWTPTFYLQSPSFDFSTATEPLFLSFDFHINGAQFQNGGNLEYSTDGGNTWAVMTQEMGTATNWYQSGEFYSLEDMDNEPGWTWSSTDYVFRHATFDLAFLEGQTDVVFRFKHFSNFSVNSTMAPVGMRIDNFTVGSASDINLCMASLPYYYNFTTYPGMCWSESNNTTLAQGTNGLESDWGVTTGFANSGNSQAAVIYIGQGGNANADWLVSPDFNVSDVDMPTGLPTATPLIAKFRIALTQMSTTNASSLDSDDVVHFVYSENDGPWTILRTWNSGTPVSSTGDEVTVGLEATGRVKFAFWASSGTTGDIEAGQFFVDNFELSQGTLSVPEPEELSVRFYPNPTRDVFNISSVETIASVEVMTLAGRKVLAQQPNSGDVQLDLSALSPGLYFVNVKSDTKTKTIKLIKK